MAAHVQTESVAGEHNTARLTGDVGDSAAYSDKCHSRNYNGSFGAGKRLLIFSPFFALLDVGLGPQRISVSQ